MGALFPGSFRHPRSRQDFFDFCFIGGKPSLQIRIQKRQSVVSPEDLTIHYKARHAKHASLDCTLSLKTKPFLDFTCVGLCQKLLPIEADIIGNLADDTIRSNISPLTPRGIEKSHRKNFSKIIFVDCRRDTKWFERVERCNRCYLERRQRYVDRILAAKLSGCQAGGAR